MLRVRFGLSYHEKSLTRMAALASAMIYTLLLFVILACNREAVAQALRALVPEAQPKQILLKQKAKTAIVALVAMGLPFAFDQLLVNLLGHWRG